MVVFDRLTHEAIRAVQNISVVVDIIKAVEDIRAGVGNRTVVGIRWCGVVV